MGRITPSYRQLYQKAIMELRARYRSSLVDPELKEAFDSLQKEAWNPEQSAMGNSTPTIPTVLDGLNLTANVHNRKLIEMLKRKIEEKDRTIGELMGRLEDMEKGIIPKSKS